MTIPAQLPPSGDMETLVRLIRIETKLDDSRKADADHEARIRQLEAERHPDHEHRLTDHEVRMRGLEKFRWQLAGAYAAGGIVGGVLGSLVGPLLGH